MDRWLIHATSANAATSPSIINPAPTLPQQPLATPAVNAASSSSSVKRRKVAGRKYSEEYMKLGFTCIDKESEYPRPQCVVCAEVLSNQSLKPSHLRRHLEGKHPSLKNKPVDYFRLCQKSLRQQCVSMESTTTVSFKLRLASYNTSYLIAKASKPYTIGEDLILPAATQMVSIICGEETAQMLNGVPLSDTTVMRRIHEMAEDVLSQLISRINQSTHYAIQLDESTDVAGVANVIVYVRYLWNNSIHEDMLFCRPLETYTTADEIFSLVCDFWEHNNISWRNLFGVCTDGARAMTGCRSGVVKRILEKAPNASWTHCSIHREALVSKNIPEQLKTVLNTAVKCVNFIKSRPLNSRLFAVLCEEMGSVHLSLLLHTEVRWLSRGRVLIRLLELRNEVHQFLLQSNNDLYLHLEDNAWLVKLAYLGDIFSRLNQLNSSLQGVSISIFDVQDRVKAMVAKIDWLCAALQLDDFSPFTNVNSMLESGMIMSEESKEMILSHLQHIKEQFNNYFVDVFTEIDSFKWIRDPFNTAYYTSLPAQQHELLIDLSSDSPLKSHFSRLSLINFWVLCRPHYPELADIAIRHLVPFVTSYLCETSFSHYTATKSKMRSRLNAEPSLRLKLSDIQPDMTKLCASKQSGH
jgi:hypothetical protein